MLQDIWTVFRRDLLVLRRRLVKFIFSRMVAPVLYLVAFGWGLGRNMGGNYMDFLVPGIIALNSMNIGFNSVTPVHAERVYHRSIEEYLTAPISYAAFVIGKTLSGVLRALISTVIIIGIAYAFGANFTPSMLFFAIVALNAAIFAEIGFFAAMRINTYEEMAQINTYLLMPMSFLCGTFFSTAALPPVARQIIELLPLTHAGIILRSASGDAPLPITSLIILASYAIIAFFAALWAFHHIRE